MKRYCQWCRTRLRLRDMRCPYCRDPAVSWLHGDVSRKMWHNIWPQVPPDEVPIGHVTNGIHTRSWLAPDIQFVLDRYLSEKWQTDPTDQSVWEGVSQIPDEELWRAHERCRAEGVVIRQAA